MPERERAYRGDELVTVIEGTPGKRGKVKIRNQYGFLEEVSGKSLTPLDKDDKFKTLRYGAPE